jgi:hypothetical protein
MKKIIVLFLLLCSGSVLADSASVIQAHIDYLQAQMAQPFSCSCSAQQANLQKMQAAQLAALQKALVSAQASPSPSPSASQ